MSGVFIIRSIVYVTHEVVSYTLDPKHFSPPFLVIEEHVRYMNMCVIEIFTHIYFDIFMRNGFREVSLTPCVSVHNH